MKTLEKYSFQAKPEEIIDDLYIRSDKDEIYIDPKGDPRENIELLYYANSSDATLLAYCHKCDKDRNLYVSLGDGLEGIINSDDITYNIMEDGKVHRSFAENKVGFNIRCLVRDIKQTDEGYKVLLSRKNVVEKLRNRYFNDLKVGDIVEGVVVSLNPTEAIISIGGDVVGILGVGNISKVFIDEPSEVLSLNQKIKVVVEEVERKGNNVFYEFNREKLLPSFEKIHDRYNEGDIVIGTIKKNMGTGYFVKLDECFEGVAKYKSNANFNYGDNVKVRINKINVDRERINLKIV